MDPANLHDIVVPEPVSWMPQTVGWLLVAIAFAALLARAGRVRYRRWQRDRYRREALVELSDLERRLNDPAGRAPALAEIPALVKRVALGAAPRNAVAPLAGAEWLEWLDATSRHAGFADGPGRLLPSLAYGGRGALEEVTDDEAGALVALVRAWIRTHRVPDDGTSTGRG